MAEPTLAPFPTTRAPQGMVCAVDHLAASAGIAILRAGGGAVDAAIATNAVLAVTTQNNCGLGGDLFALVHRPGDAAPFCLDAAGEAGSGADAAQLRAEGHRRMPFTGDVRSVTVPGCVDGWVALHDRFGSLPLSDVLTPARTYAEEGFPTSPLLALMAPFVADLPGASDYRADLRPGDLIRRPGIAATLAAIAEGGRAPFYEGEFGHGLRQLGGGLFSAEDLARPQARWVEPLGIDAWGHRIWTVPPPSQGYLTLSSAGIAEVTGFTAGSAPPPDDPAWAHVLVEVAKQAGHDRPAVLHDGADGPALLAPARIRAAADAIDPDRARPLPAPSALGDTIHLAVVDSAGVGVSLIQSNAAGFGANLIVAPPGVFLHNRGIGFSLESGHPAEYGPGRRPPHTLSPALVTRPDGTLRLVLGTMGGDSQPQILLQLLARTLVDEQEPGDAVAAARWVLRGGPNAGGFDTWTGDDQVVAVEGHAPPAWFEGMARRGHNLDRRAPFDHLAGHAHLIEVEEDHLAGASDPRAGAGAAVGW